VTFEQQRVRKLKTGVGKVAVIAWFTALTVMSAGLLSRHLLAMPTPKPTSQLGQSLHALEPVTAHRWLAVHVLSSECRCSQRIATHLLETQRPADWREVVLWVGDDAPPRELARRFDVRRVTRHELAGYGIEAAPLLVAVTPAGEVAYVGGYTDRKQGPVFHDLDVLTAAHSAVAVASLPVFGCATSDRLRSALSRLPTP
jgi:hypothetical protein